MATRVVEGKKPYTGGKAISIDENKVISLNLRDENNLIIYDEGDDEIYVDLQLDDEITPTSAFPIGVNTGRVIVDNGWDKTGTIICAKTTSGDNIKLFYADEGTLWIDNGTGTFKQIYFKADVDALLLALRNYIDGELAKKQNGVSSDTAPEDPAQGDLWYDTTNNVLKVYDGSQWDSTGGGSDIEYVTQAEYNALLPGALTDNKHYFIYTGSSRLPAEYQEVEYIAGTGDYNNHYKNYINTGVVGTSDIGGYTKMSYNNSINNGCFFQSLSGDNTTRRGMTQYPAGCWCPQRVSRHQTDVAFSTNQFYEIKLNWNNDKECQIDGTNILSLTGTFTGSTSILIGADNQGTQNEWKCAFFKITDGTTLIRDYVPCYRIADGVIGLYDLVNDTFYTNSGTGTFTKGPDVN